MKFEEWLSQQGGLIEVDCGCVTAEAFYHWLRVAYEFGTLTNEGTIQSGNSGQPVTVPDDTRRMDWLVSKTVNVREPMVYGSHDLFWSQTISDDWEEEHKTTLREQIDAAMAAAPKV